MFLTVLFITLQVFMSSLEAIPIDGNVVLAGNDIKVIGETAVEAAVPTSGNVEFTGQLHASGSVKIVGSSCLGSQKLATSTTSPISLTPTALGANLLPTFAKGYKVPSTYVLPKFAPTPRDILSKLLESSTRKKKLFVLIDFPFKMSGLNNNCKRQIFDVNVPPISVPNAEPIIDDVCDSEPICDLDLGVDPILPTVVVDFDEIIPNNDNHFIDTSSMLLPVRGSFTLVGHF